MFTGKIQKTKKKSPFQNGAQGLRGTQDRKNIGIQSPNILDPMDWKKIQKTAKLIVGWT